VRLVRRQIAIGEEMKQEREDASVSVSRGEVSRVGSHGDAEYARTS